MKEFINFLIDEIKDVWYALNEEFGSRVYFKKDGVLYIKEGFNKPEILKEHLKNHHPDEYIETFGRRDKKDGL